MIVLDLCFEIYQMNCENELISYLTVLNLLQMYKTQVCKMKQFMKQQDFCLKSKPPSLLND